MRTRVTVPMCSDLKKQKPSTYLKARYIKGFKPLEPLSGFGPETSSLPRMRSTD